MKLILVRHGETHWNEERRIQGGDSDIELNDTGLEQARRLAAFLQNEPIIAILSSPLRRATATAEVIASRHRLPVEVDQGFRELRVGELEGISVSDLGTTFSQFLMRWWQDRGATKLPNGESLVELQERAWKAVERLLERSRLVGVNPEHNEGTTVVVVSHYFVILAIILKALNLPLDCFTKFKVDPGGVSILEFRNYGARLVTFNDTSYQG
ncbi:MAG: histidine phosphatase family protein [Chloroflexi bacterium]|nr:histidine phosphatase family protein [Chloroflexota bacterium]